MSRTTPQRFCSVAVLTAGTFGVLTLGGCADPVKAPGAGVADPLPAAAYPQIEAADGLAGFIVYGEPKVSREKIMGVTVPIRAATNHEEVRVQYRFQFFDKNGVPIGEEPTWRYTKLASRRQEFLQGNAIDSGAADWRLQIRPAR